MPRPKTILLAEDEPVVRMLTSRLLKGAGFEVLAADGPIAAASQARDHPGPIDLLLSDVVMPGLSGPELAIQVREWRPDITVRFFSGYAEGGHGAVPAPGAPWLDKPFTRDELLAFVNRALTDSTGECSPEVSA